MGIEPMIKVLQTSALPLGYVARIEKEADGIRLYCVSLMPPAVNRGVRAGDGIRTRDLLLGKETFYH
jgi:hypothetical protein